MVEDTKVLVVSHKEFDDSVIPKGYQVIKVGNKISSDVVLEKGYWEDNTGINIAEKNPYYCELTAQYWAWKNMDDNIKYTGIVHYRRFFFDYYSRENKYENILKEDRLKEILNRYKVIIGFDSIKHSGDSYLYRIRKYKNEINWIIIRDIIYQDYPEYKKTFNKIIYGKTIVWGNMFISSKEVFDQYSKWLFDVLEKYDNAIMKAGYEKEKRVNGFLSELLLLVFLKKNFSEKMIYRLEVRNIETDEFAENNDNLKGKILFYIRSHYKLLCVAHKVGKAVYWLVR